MSSAMRPSTFPVHYPSAVCVNVFVVSIMTLFFRKMHVVLLHACGLLRLVACLPLSLMCPQFGFDTDRTVSWAVMDHGDLLRECRLMLHSISSQISILVAGLQRLEGQQRHLLLSLPPAAPGGHPPLPPPLTPAPPSPKASSVRPPHPPVPITLVATSTNRMEPADLIEPVSDSASREHNRRRRSRHRDLHRRRSRSRSHRRRPLGRRARPILASDHHVVVPKPPPAVKAMPACRPSGLSYGR